MKKLALNLAAILILSGFLWFMLQEKKKHRYDINQALKVDNIVPLVVIGSGPAGLSAALYGARSAVYTVVFEGKKPGGQLTETTYVENWPGTPKQLGSKLIDQTRKQAETFGALMIHDSIVDIDCSSWPFKLKTEEGAQIHALALIISTGSSPKKLSDMKKVPGEQEYWGYGVTTCAVCDAPFYKDKEVVVVGGGDSAIEEATLLTSYAKKVYLLVRGSSMRAASAMQARLKTAPKITVLFNTEITEIVGTGSAVTSVKIVNNKDKSTKELPVEGVFLAIGHVPNSQLVTKCVKTDNGYIVLPTRTQRTSKAGIFAAGDVADHMYRQAGVAAGDGIKAALDALAFLQSLGYTQQKAQEMEKNYWYPHLETGTKPLPKLAKNKEFDALAKEHPFIVLEVGGKDCTSCTSLMPIVQSVAAQLSDKAHFGYVDRDTEPKELIKRFEIKGIPALLVFKKDALIARYDQHMFTRRELNATLNKLIAEHS